MPARNSIPEQPPDFSPGLPLYPHLAQLCRVSSPSILPGLYPAFTQQWSGGALTMRDREPCYVWEPNLVPLGQAIYDCRLVGSYSGLPLYATSCCVPPSSSSSSSLSSLTSFTSSSSSVSPIQLFALGSISTEDSVNTVLTLPVVSLLAGDLLVVVTGMVGVAPLAQDQGVTYGGTPLVFSSGGDVPGATPGRCATWTLEVLADTTADIVSTVNSAAWQGLQALAVLGLENNLLDKNGGGGDLASVPDTGLTGSLVSAREAAIVGFLMLAPGGAWTWQDGFATTGQDLTGLFAGTTAVSLTGGYLLTSSTAPVQATLGGVTPAAWAEALATYY